MDDKREWQPLEADPDGNFLFYFHGSTWTGKMGEYFPVGERPGDFTQITGKSGEILEKSQENLPARKSKNHGNMMVPYFVVYKLQIKYWKMEKIPEKSGKFVIPKSRVP